MNDVSPPALATPSSRLVDFLLSLKPDNLTVPVIREARIRLLDSLGCGLYGALMPWSKIVSEVVYEEQSIGGATVYGNRKPVAPARAALVNDTAIHGIELDDIVAVHAHPGSVVVPAVLAIAEHYELPGTRVLLGLIAGYGGDGARHTHQDDTGHGGLCQRHGRTVCRDE